MEVVRFSEEMIPQASRLHVEAFSHHMNGRLGRRYAEAFLRWFCQADAAVILAAVDTGEVIAYVAGAPPSEGRRRLRALAPVAARTLLARPWLILDKRLPAMVFTRLKLLFGREEDSVAPVALPAPTMSLVAIAVSGARRREGVGIRLVKAFEEEARRLRMNSLRLSARRDNLPARRLYEACGWEPYSRESGATDVVYYVKRRL
ncbi:MAG: GNAT family N-acetyltransferase [Actinomycetota bacterium]|nr:GNAT family N-acetyltransferase [Actinomycetota bacterium]